MAGYSNFQNKNNLYSDKKQRTNIYEPAFQTPVSSLTKEQEKGFDANLDKWVDFISWCRWYPDLWYDLCRPKKGGISLDLDQRVFLRSLSRFVSNYCVFPRGKCSHLH
jgi:ribonucleoside-diphosphate reductase alpha chain